MDTRNFVVANEPTHSTNCHRQTFAKANLHADDDIGGHTTIIIGDWHKDDHHHDDHHDHRPRVGLILIDFDEVSVVVTIHYVSLHVTSIAVLLADLCKSGAENTGRLARLANHHKRGPCEGRPSLV